MIARDSGATSIPAITQAKERESIGVLRGGNREVSLGMKRGQIQVVDQTRTIAST
jgi:hypothetical protein